MKLIRLNSFLYLFCILSVFASCVQKPDSSVEDWNRTFINTRLRKALSEVSDWGIENKKFCYQLKSPISLKKSLNE